MAERSSDVWEESERNAGEVISNDSASRKTVVFGSKVGPASTRAGTARSENNDKKRNNSDDYSHIIRSKENDPYKLLIQTFCNDDLVEVIKNEKSNMDFKQMSLSPILKYAGFLFRGSIYYLYYYLF